MKDYADSFYDRYSTSLIADAAFRAGVALGVASPGLKPLDLDVKLAGPALTVEANNDLVSILEAVHRAEPGQVIAVANRTPEVGLMGDLIGTEAARKGLAGFVVDGLVRDAVELVRLEVAVISRGSYPVGPLKVASRQRGVGEVGIPITIGGIEVTTGAWVFGDADGVIVLGNEDLPRVFEGADRAATQEAALADEIRSGTPLGVAFELDEFLAQRAQDPNADFNSHLAEIGRAI